MADDILHRFAERTRNDSFFLGATLEAYQRCHDCNDDDLATRLGCRVEDLQRLATCRAPSPTSRRFRSEVMSIAEYVGCDPYELLAMLREVGATSTLREEQVPSTGAGYLLAARDRKSDSTEGEKEPDVDDQDGA